MTSLQTSFQFIQALQKRMNIFICQTIEQERIECLSSVGMTFKDETSLLIVLCLIGTKREKDKRDLHMFSCEHEETQGMDRQKRTCIFV